MKQIVSGYGTWKSPLTAARVTAGSLRFDHAVLDGDTLYWVVDRKPKASPNLRRLENIRTNPDAVSVIVDHYEEDWSRLWWVRVRGTARVLDSGEEFESAVRLLREKYPQYRDQPPEGPVLAIDASEWREWAAA